MNELNLKVLAYVTKVYNSGGSKVVVVPKKIRYILDLIEGDLVQVSITKIGLNDKDDKVIRPSGLPNLKAGAGEDRG